MVQFCISGLSSQSNGGLLLLQAQEDSRTGGDAYEDRLRDHLQGWIDAEPVYGEQWTLHLLAGILDTLPLTFVLGQEGARPPALWHADKLHLPSHAVRLDQDPRNRAMVFVLAAGPAFLASLCDTFWGADGHLAALLGTCAYGLSANRSSVFVTGAPGSGKTRSCAFMGILVACLTGKLTLYTAHGNESVRAYVEAADRLTAESHSLVRSRIVRVPASKDTRKLPFDAHDAGSGTELLEKKTCGLNAIPSTLFTPATLPEALTRQIQHGPGTWKKGQGEMPP